MSYRRMVSQGVVWVEDTCREDYEQEVAKAAATIKAKDAEIKRLHELIRDRIPTAAAPVEKMEGGV